MKKLHKMANENFNVSKINNAFLLNTDLYKRKPDQTVFPERFFRKTSIKRPSFQEILLLKMDQQLFKRLSFQKITKNISVTVLTFINAKFLKM